jgi:hypothetical protein
MYFEMVFNCCQVTVHAQSHLIDPTVVCPETSCTHCFVVNLRLSSGDGGCSGFSTHVHVRTYMRTLDPISHFPRIRTCTVSYILRPLHPPSPTSSLPYILRPLHPPSPTSSLPHILPPLHPPSPTSSIPYILRLLHPPSPLHPPSSTHVS